MSTKNIIDNPMEDGEEGINVNYSVNRLEKISSQLRFVGNAVFLSTLINLFSTFASFYFSRQWNAIIALKNSGQNSGYYYSTYGVEQSFYIAAFLSFIFFAISVFLLITYDKQKRQGNVLFEEISDELQWWTLEKNVSGIKKKNDSNSLERERPILRIRIALREYVHTTELPLLKGTSSIALYLLLNILSAVSTAIAMYMSAGIY
jgi:hypothetical protein